MVRDSLSVGIAVGTYGVSFGAAGTAAGLTPLQTCLLSLVAFTGASQFALAGVLAGGGAPLAGAAGALLLGTRNTVYALRLAPLLRGRRALASLFIIDESTAVAVAQRTPDLQRLGFWVTGLSVYAGWNLMTLVGAVGAQALGDPRTLGLDAAVSAAFLGLLWPHLASARGRLVALSAVAVALVAVPLAPVGVPVLLAALTVLPWALWRRSGRAGSAVEQRPGRGGAGAAGDDGSARRRADGAAGHASARSGSRRADEAASRVPAGEGP